jgi:hypothetical protein
VLNQLLDIIIDNRDANIDSEIYNQEWASVYTADLLDWLKENLNRVSDVDDAIDSGSVTLVAAISGAMYNSRCNMALDFYDAIKEMMI